MRAKYTIAAVSAVLVAAIAGGFLLRSKRPAAEEPQAGAKAPVPANALGFPATIRARHVTPVPAPVDGVLEEVFVAPGDAVYEGQILARIRNEMLESEHELAVRELDDATERLHRLEAELANRRLEHSRAAAERARVQTEFDAIQKNYLRQQRLYSEGATPRLVFEKVEKEYLRARDERDTAYELERGATARFDDAQKRYDALRIERDLRSRELEEANARIAAADVRSPVTGVLVAITRNVGEPVPAELPDLARVAVNLAELEAVVDAPPEQLAAFRSGMEALLTFAEFPDALPGVVREIEGNQAIIEFTTPTPAIAPGATAQVRLRIE
ncbi:MAG: HlyD family secretion protein [bacterium]